MRSLLRIFIFTVCILLMACLIVPQSLPASQTHSQPSAQIPAHLTLEDAHRIALQNHPQIQAAQSAAAAAGEITTQARSAYYPNVYGSITGAEADNGSRIAAGYLNNPSVFNRFASGVSLEQLVTDFGRTQNLVASAKLRAQAAEAGVNFSRADVLLSVDRAFYGALRAQAILTVAEQTVKQRQTAADQITVLAQNQRKSGLDVSFANVVLSEARLLLVKAQNDVQSSQAVLSEALGVSSQQPFDLVDPQSAALALPPVEDAIAQANQLRPEITVLRLSVNSAQHFATAERDLLFPTISLAGVAGVVPFHQPQLPEAYSAAGFNVHIPIFNGKLYSSRRAEAQDRTRQVQASLTDIQGKIARDVRLAWLSANTAFQNLSLTAQLFESASKALDLAQSRYDLGLGSIVELSQAQLNAAEAGIAEASAKYDYATRLAELAYQEGQLR